MLTKFVTLRSLDLLQQDSPAPAALTANGRWYDEEQRFFSSLVLGIVFQPEDMGIFVNEFDHERLAVSGE